MRKGTPNQLINEMLDKINELKSVESAQEIDAACDNDKVKAGCEEDVEAGCSDKVKAGCGTKSAVIFDEDDVIEADDDIEFEEEEKEYYAGDEEEFFEEKEVFDDETTEELVEDLDTDDYLDNLYHRVEESLGDLTEGISWDNDKDNIFLDITFTDGHIFTFTIPKADLAYDLGSLDEDAEYICVAVRDNHEPESEEFEEKEVVEEEDYTPAYL